MDPKTENQEPDDIRSAIESAIEEVEAPDTSADTPEVPSTGESSAPASEPQGSAAPAPSSPVPPPPDLGQSAPSPAPVAGPLEKPPGTWTPAAREKWGSLDPELRSEIWKREKEASRAMTASSDARRFHNDFTQAVQPFMGFIAAEQSTPIQAMVNMMQTAAALRVGTPQQKVQIAADIIRNFGVDLHALDATLAGQQPQYNPQTLIQQEIQRALTPFQQAQSQFQQRLQQQDKALDAEVDQDILTFSSDPKHEFYDDVKEVMADLIEMGLRRGQQVSLTEAYERATLIHEPVRRVIEGRKQTEAARAAAQRARSARNAAGSITPSSEANVAQPVPGDSIRSALEFAINQQQGR